MRDQSEIHVRSKGQVFVGVYVANAGLEDVSIPTPVAAVADALRKEVPQALVLVVRAPPCCGAYRLAHHV